MVIGTSAYCGSGQDTLAEGFCIHRGFQKFSLGDIIRDIARERKLPCKRENLQKIREECDRTYGREFVAEQTMRKIKCEFREDIVITGIRTIEEYLFFKNRLNMVLIFVYADKKIRFQRMIKRADEKDETNVLELQKRMAKEIELFDYKELERYADIRYVFNMDLEDYLNEEKQVIDSLMCHIDSLSCAEEEKCIKKRKEFFL